jgi:CubicO group peptidase (beta-lactamase class C family)
MQYFIFGFTFLMKALSVYEGGTTMLQSRLRQIEMEMEASCRRGEIAGANFLLTQNGEEIFYGEAGYADRDARMPMGRDTIFRLYSMSKPVTAAACMLLLERGVLDLMDPVSRYIPEFSGQMVWDGDKKVPARREVILKDLLGMQSGLSYGGESPAGREIQLLLEEAARLAEQGRPLSTRELAGRLGKCMLEFQPGERWMYGLSADVLGAVIEEAAGKPFGQFLQEELFEPLGMEDTGFYVPEGKQRRLARTYEDSPEGLREYTGDHLLIQNRMKTPPVFESGGAGLCSTIDDYNRFAQMLLQGGKCKGRRILSPCTVQFMTTPQLPEDQRYRMNWDGLWGYSYGNLMRILVKPGEAVVPGSAGEYGWDGWLGPYFCNLPKGNITILFMMQKTGAGTWNLTRRLRNLALAAMEV